jgi:hypothetical protein
MWFVEPLYAGGEFPRAKEEQLPLPLAGFSICASVTAVPQLLHPEPTAIKWHFSQENATLLDAGKGM